MKVIGIFLIAAVLIVGEVKCIFKVLKCNWEPIGKAEAVYSVGVLTGLGCFIGYMDIKDK
tara:strand:+ start:1936 stop:2115 length:180 start_codon:yes stop_codon:yes gene_type:complete